MLSAAELGKYVLCVDGTWYIVELTPHALPSSTTITMDTLKAFSANVNLHPQAGAPAAITIPLVQGMGFVTGYYNGVKPVINSGILFRTVTRATEFNRAGMAKYRILLEDGKTVSFHSWE